MKDYIKLADATTIKIEGGASLDRIIHIAETDAKAVEVCAAITPANLKHVEFWNPDREEPHSIYETLTMDTAPTRQTNTDGTVTVTISLREKTSIELRLDALEESQATQDGAIEDLGMVVSDLTEG